MRGYIIRRLLLSIPTLFLISLFIFLMIHLIPGSVVDMAISEAELISPAMRQQIEHELGLDAPFFIQYGRWVWNIMHGDLGNSLFTRTPVIEKIATRWPVTFELGLIGIIVALLIALPVGVLSALRQETWIDYVARSFAIFCIAVPSFWLGTLVIVFPSIWWGYMPPIKLIRFSEDPLGNLQMFIIPGILLGMSLSGITMRMTRNMMLEVMRQDYIRTAWAKGLRERVIIIRHALKNALIPVVTLLGLQVPVIIGGTVIIEQIFQLPGMGRLIVDSTNVRDYTTFSSVLLIFAVFIVVINLIVDLIYGLLDPRISYE
jgi:peptide/nickel transport system permease protein